MRRRTGGRLVRPQLRLPQIVWSISKRRLYQPQRFLEVAGHALHERVRTPYVIAHIDGSGERQTVPSARPSSVPSLPPTAGWVGRPTSAIGTLRWQRPDAGSYSFEMSSLVVFSVDVHRLAAFYEAVLGAKPHHEPSGDIRLLGDREEVLVHSVPAKIAKTIEVRTPPEPREGGQRSSQCSMSTPSKLPWNRSTHREEWLQGGRSASMASHGTT